MTCLLLKLLLLFKENQNPKNMIQEDISVTYFIFLYNAQFYRGILSFLYEFLKKIGA